MSNGSRTLAQQLYAGLRWVSLGAIALLALFMTGATALAFLGLMPWPELIAVYGGEPVPNAGQWVQVILTVLSIALCFFVPPAARVLKLEDSHRDFTLSMDDIAKAYQVSHAADRNGAFSLSAEFDSIRERIDYMRTHPDLRSLEPAVLEVAAQMSHESRDLAQIYAVDRVDRARLFLKQRQEELDTFAERLTLAKQTISEIRRWSQQLHVEESVQTRQLEQLEKDLLELLPGLGFDIDDDLSQDKPLILDQRAAPDLHTADKHAPDLHAPDLDANVVPMASKPSAAAPAE